jgi:hypoxanthine-DNA glycosylase
MNAAHVAVWDVLASCTRPGSLDSRIVDSSAEPNDIAEFFATHRAIVRVCFNGAKAEALFRRYVATGLTDARLDYVRLPSTSPANASIPFARKVELWREGLALSCAPS